MSHSSAGLSQRKGSGCACQREATVLSRRARRTKDCSANAVALPDVPPRRVLHSYPLVLHPAHKQLLSLPWPYLLFGPASLPVSLFLTLLFPGTLHRAHPLNIGLLVNLARCSLVSEPAFLSHRLLKVSPLIQKCACLVSLRYIRFSSRDELFPQGLFTRLLILQRPGCTGHSSASAADGG